MTSDLDHLQDYFLSLCFAAQPYTYRKAAASQALREHIGPPSPAGAHSRRPASGCPPTEGALGEGVCLGGPWSLPATPTPASPYSCSLSCSIRLLIKLTRASRYPVWEGLSG